MNKFAIDIVLLPPEEVMNKAIELNQSYAPKIQLSKTDRLPHITLSQAVISADVLDTARSRLSEVSKQFKPMELEAKIVNDPDSFFRISPRELVLKLHEEVMAEFEDLVSYDAKEEYFLDDEVRPQSLAWVSNFRTDGAFDNFDPHISLGVKKKIQDEDPIVFIVDRLAICHLGNFNTCRKILFEIKL